MYFWQRTTKDYSRFSPLQARSIKVEAFFVLCGKFMEAGTWYLPSREFPKDCFYYEEWWSKTCVVCVFLLIFQIVCIKQFPRLSSYANFQDFQALSKKLCVILSNFKLFGLCHVYVLVLKKWISPSQFQSFYLRFTNFQANFQAFHVCACPWFLVFVFLVFVSLSLALVFVCVLYCSKSSFRKEHEVFAFLLFQEEAFLFFNIVCESTNSNLGNNQVDTLVFLFNFCEFIPCLGGFKEWFQRKHETKLKWGVNMHLNMVRF